MKLKLNLDKKTIQDFLLQNVEKIVLGLIVVVMLLMLYSAWTGAGRFERTPEQLLQAVDNGKKEIERTPADSAELVVADYASQATQSRAEVAVKPYSHTVLWDKPLFDKRPLRDAPPLFAVQKLRGASGVGAFRTVAVAAARPAAARRTGRAGADAAAPAATTRGDTLSGQRWIVVTGLVPIERQETAYTEAFKQSVFYDPQRDYPAYLGYWVERVEVSSAGDEANPNWDKATKFMSKQAINGALETWSATASKEVVAGKYLDDTLAFPLGPLVNQTWGPDVAHEPEIPVRKGAEREMGMGGMGMGEGELRGNRARTGQRAMMPGPMMDGGRGAARGDQMAEDTPFADTPTDDKQTRRAQAELKEDADEDKTLSYKLFRFFDFTVEPGKQYMYRVCLGLANPNRGLKTSLLKKPELAEEKFLKTKWSEPSPVLAVARDTRILAVSVTPARSSIDSTSTILVTKWLKTKGIEAFVEKSKIGRGQLCDFPKEEFRPPAARRGRMGDGDMGGATSRSKITVDFITGATMVDLRGGERLGRKGVSAGEVLVLDSNGNLFVRNELDDYPTYEQLTGAGAEPAVEEGRGGLDGMMRPPMMGPGMPGMPGMGLDAIPEDRRGRR